MLCVQLDGARSWVLRFRRNGKSRTRRVTLGWTGMLTPDRLRTAVLAFRAIEKGDERPLPVPSSGPTLARLAAEYMEQCSPAWKPSSRAVVISYLNSAILPVLGHLRVDAVTRTDMARWFHHYRQRRPGGRQPLSRNPALRVRPPHRLGTVRRLRETPARASPASAVGRAVSSGPRGSGSGPRGSGEVGATLSHPNASGKSGRSGRCLSKPALGFPRGAGVI